MGTARALQNDLLQATGMNVSDQTIRTKPHEGGLGRHIPGAVGPGFHLVFSQFLEDEGIDTTDKSPCSPDTHLGHYI